MCGLYTATNLPHDGETIDAADVNTDLQGLIDEFNGNIENDNLKDLSVITSKMKPTYYQVFNSGTYTFGAESNIPGLTQDVTVAANALALVFWGGYVDLGIAAPTYTASVLLNVGGANVDSVDYCHSSATGIFDAKDMMKMRLVELSSGTTTIKIRGSGSASCNLLVNYQKLCIVLFGR